MQLKPISPPHQITDDFRATEFSVPCEGVGTTFNKTFVDISENFLFFFPQVGGMLVILPKGWKHLKTVVVFWLHNWLYTKLTHFFRLHA
jgi:hypothetical protein